MEKELYEILRKKAVGYTVSEVVTEYDTDGNEIKQKVTQKDIQPDLSALKLLIELTDDQPLTEEELLEEREKILKELDKFYKTKTKKKKDSKNGNQQM